MNGARPEAMRDEPKLVSVIVPAHDASATLDRQLAALAAQTYGGSWETVVVDNLSQDDTRAIALAWADRLPELRVVEAAERASANYARNVGARSARGDLLLYCDADDEVDEGWLAAMAAASRYYDLFGGRIESRTLNTEVALRWREELPQDSELPRLGDWLPYSLSANFGIWSDVFRSLGSWDESFSRGGDDVELCWRAGLESFRIGFVPEAVVHYRYRADLRGMARQHFGYGTAEPKLYKKFKRSGFRNHGLRSVFLIYLRLAKDVPYLVTRPHMRGPWLRKVAHALGRIVGSVENRVFFL